MRMTDTYVLKKIISILKSRKGCPLLDLTVAIPPEYMSPDEDPKYLLLEPIKVLINLGLVEVYLDDKLISIKEINSFHKWFIPKNIYFYITKTALEIEETLDIKLDTFQTTIFGKPSLYLDVEDIFVLMPFSEELRPIYEDQIKEVANNLDLKVARSDDFFTVGSIMADIWSAINNSKIVIADCTGRNPNVFYEIGIAHAIGKFTILITQSIEDVPFDLRHLRTIIYQFTPRGMEKFKENLKMTINSSGIIDYRSKNYDGRWMGSD